MTFGSIIQLNPFSKDQVFLGVFVGSILGAYLTLVQTSDRKYLK